jgi:copper transport protein
MRRTLAVAVLAALSWSGSARAHASFVRSEPPDGAVLSQAPRSVRVFFGDEIRPAEGTLVVRNDGGAVTTGRATARGRELVIPLRRGLPRADYTARWRVVSADGHDLEGVLAFAVGAGRPPPRPTLPLLGTSPDAVDIVSRWLFLLGLLAAAGALSFTPLVWRPALRAASLRRAEEASARRIEQGAATVIAMAGFLLVFLGLGHAPGGAEATRFTRVSDVGAFAAVVGLAAAGLGHYHRRLRPLAAAAALVLAFVPTLRGHALDPGEPRLLNAAADLVHVVAVAVWVGGLFQLAVLLPGLKRALEEPVRNRLSFALGRRFSAVALVAVLVIAATGVTRAFFELSAVEQLWTTGYGRAIVVKTSLLAALVALGWLNRYRLLPGRMLAPLRRSILAEAVLAACVIVVVAFLTDLRPGRQEGSSGPSRSFSTSSR